jgi:anti-anti-sigma regulatory factor
MAGVHELIDCFGREVFVVRGSIAREDVEQLQAAVRAHQAAFVRRPAVLDLREVASIDQDAADALRSVVRTWNTGSERLVLCNVNDALQRVIGEGGWSAS